MPPSCVDLPYVLIQKTKKNAQDAQANGFVATLKDNAETKMGILHAAYGDYIQILSLNLCLHLIRHFFIFFYFFLFSGLGAFASPLVATQFAQLPRWSFHFLCSLGIALSNTILLMAVFKLRCQDGKYIYIDINTNSIHHFLT